VAVLIMIQLDYCWSRDDAQSRLY